MIFGLFSSPTLLGRRFTTALLALLLGIGGCAPRTAGVPAPEAAADTLVLMGTTDVHGWLLPFDYFSGEDTPHGLGRLLPLMDSIREAHPGATVLLDSGDLLQGNPLAFVFSRTEVAEVHPIIRAMNLAGYDAAAIGNHEFNYGIDHLERAMQQAEFPFLSANTFLAGTAERAFRPHVILERQIDGEPVRIGVTAVVPPGVALWDRDNVAGRLEFRNIVESVRPVVEEMRSRGAEVIVIASHGGLEGTSYDTATTGLPPENAAAAMAREISGIDVIFMGHTHREVADTIIAGTLLLQAKNWAASLAVAELELIRRPGGKWEITDKRGMIVRPSPEQLDPAFAAALAEPHERTLAYVNQVIGTSTEEWSAAAARTRDTPIIDLINEVQREVTGAELSATAAFSLDARIPEGPITVADVASLYVYDNTLKAVRISGEQLRLYVEKSAEYYLPCPGSECARVTNPDLPGYNFDILSGADYTLDLRRPIGERVVRLEVDGAPVAPTDSFTIALNNYRASGSGGFSMLADAPLVYDRGESIRDLLIEDIRRRGTLSPKGVFEQNWEILPKELADRALREQSAARNHR